MDYLGLMPLIPLLALLLAGSSGSPVRDKLPEWRKYVHLTIAVAHRY